MNKRIDPAALALLNEKPAEELINEKSAAELLDVNVGTLQVWRNTKRYPLRYIKIGRNVRYRRGDIQEFIAARTVEA